jgi:hypothetical protein
VRCRSPAVLSRPRINGERATPASLCTPTVRGFQDVTAIERGTPRQKTCVTPLCPKAHADAVRRCTGADRGAGHADIA